MLAGRDRAAASAGAPTLTYGMRALLNEDGRAAPLARRGDPPPVDGAAASGRVFKTISEPHVGDVTLFRLYAGEVKNGRRGLERGARGGREAQPPLGAAGEGADRGRAAVARATSARWPSSRDTHTNDTFCRRDHPVRLPPIALPESVATSAVLVKQRGEEDKLAAGLHKLHEEDPTFHFEYSSELGQTLIHGMGERHFEIILGRLERKFGVHAELVRPRVAYRETIKGKAEGQGKHKKQTGGRGQYGDCWIRHRPAAARRGLRVRGQDRGRGDPQQVHPGGGPRDPGGRGAGRGRGLSAGGLPGRVLRRLVPRRGLERDVVQDGRHPGLPERRAQGRPVLLEPLIDVEVWAPDGRAGRRDGRSLSARRGHILGTEADGRLTKVRAIVPEAELYKYSTTLHSITHGRGTSTSSTTGTPKRRRR